MNPFAIALVLLSTGMHAGWNLLGKKQESVHHFFRRMLWFILGVGLVPQLLLDWFQGPLPTYALWCALGSGAFCGFYYFSLAHAYTLGDFSVVYPMARAIPVVLVGLADALLGRPPSLVGWAGMLLVTFGCLIAPLPSLRRLRWIHYRNRTQVWILSTALGTVGYTLFDKSAADAVPPGLLSAVRYGYLLFAGAAIVYEILLRIFDRKALQHPGPMSRSMPMLGASFTFGAYGLVLWAYQLSEKAGYVVAFRQFSIVIGVVLGLLLFHEKHQAVRLSAALIICAGLVAIGVWG